MKYPKFLRKNESVIGITAPSDGRASEIDGIRLDNAKAQFEKRGYECIETASVRKSEKERSADGLTRAKEYMELVDNDKVDLILAATGGDFLYEMLEYVDYDKLAEKPVWFEGMSDPTGLSYTITTISDVASVYGTNAGAFGMKDWDRALVENLEVLEGVRSEQSSHDTYQSGWGNVETGDEGYEKDTPVAVKCLTGECAKFSGRMIGGCMDVILSLCGTCFDKTVDFINRYKNDGFIWYLEVFSMTPEQLSIYLWKFKMAGYFEHVKGFMFGRPCMINDSYSVIGYYEAITDVLGEMNVPILVDMDFGHRPPYNTIVNGAIGEVEFKDGKSTIRMIYE